ncbi:hypothetical protein [Yoonia sp. 2307UL14-13]|uniref:hypothetical protein n=1 Tax=Yoonia sp. 2307UL14-13 TaxID=3126506 RepID=UPI0030A8E654
MAQDLEQISRPEIAADHCPDEWAAITTLEPDLWADTPTIGIDPAFRPVETDAFNKYFVQIMAFEKHVASVIALEKPANQTGARFDRAKAAFDLSSCLTLTPTERDLVVTAYQAQRPDLTQDRIRTALFNGFDEYTCMGLADVSAQIFTLDPEDAAFAADYAMIMSSALNDCG